MKSLQSRRSFFKTSAQAGLALSSFGFLNNATAVEPIKRVGKPRFLLTVAAYSFRDYLNHKDPAKKIDLFDFIDFCADQGCDGAELTSYYFPKPVTDEYLLKVRRHAFLRGVAVSGTAVGNNFAQPKGEKLTEQIKDVKNWIDHAAILGAPHIRVFSGNNAPPGMTEAEARRLSVEPLEECCEYAGKRGIFLGLEDHGKMMCTADSLLEVVKAVKSPWLAVNLDTGNFKSADPYSDIARCAPYAVNVQIKPFVHIGEERVPADFARIFKIFTEANYQGYIGLEYELKEDPWKAVPELLAQLKSFTDGSVARTQRSMLQKPRATRR
jgi:sugar phosphate isomerase/epimerase